MNKFIIELIMTTALAGFSVSNARVAAAQEAPVLADAYRVSAEVTMLNNEAKMPQGDRIVLSQISENFNVTSDRINILISKNMQYGDIAAVLAFAELLPGGMSDGNIDQVVKIRQASAGWDRTADVLFNSFHISADDVAVKLSSIEDEAHGKIKLALVESLERARAGSAAGGQGQVSGGASGRPGGGTVEGTTTGESGGRSY